MKFLKLLFLVIQTHCVCAQYYDEIRGAKNASLGYVHNAEGSFSSYNHPALSAFTDSNSVALDVQNRFGVKELSTISAGVSYKFNTINTALFINQFGSSLYKEQGIHLSAGRKLTDDFSIGLRISYFLSAIDQQTKGQHLSPMLSSCYQLNNWKFTFQYQFIKALQRETSNTSSDQNRINFGANYSTELFRFYGEVDLNGSQKPDLKIGAEFPFQGIVFLRVGTFQTFRGLSFGFGIKLKDLQFNAATSYQNQLGLSPQVSLAYAF